MFKKSYLTIYTLLIVLTACQDISGQPTTESTTNVEVTNQSTTNIESENKEPVKTTDLAEGQTIDLSNIQQQLSQQTLINQQLDARLTTLQQQYEELLVKLNKLLPNQVLHEANIEPYDHAVILYRQKLYGQVIQVLQPYNSAGNIDQHAAKALWLMIQAHYHLKHCESVMTSVKQFNNRFPKDNNLPNAWLLMADCQAKMQQNDIARDTLRFIIRAYPDSLAAQKAKKQLDRK